MNPLARRPHIVALRQNPDVQRLVVKLSDEIEAVGCCHRHRAGLLNVVYTGILRTLGYSEEFCLDMLRAVDLLVDVAHQDEAPRETEH